MRLKMSKRRAEEGSERGSANLEPKISSAVGPGTQGGRRADILQSERTRLGIPGTPDDPL